MDIRVLIAISIEKNVVYRFSKPDKGEVYQPFEILPPATATFQNKVTLFNTNDAKEIAIKIVASPREINFNIAQKGDQQTVVFNLHPPHKESEASIQALININDKLYTNELIEIDYDHVPKQSILLPSTAKAVRLDLEKSGENIGYIMGAGDEIPESLKQIGYNVRVLKPDEITKENLERFDAVVVGIRAYNVVDELKYKQPLLLEYVTHGGTMIVQYNTSGRNGLDVMPPYPLQLSRDRVTEENAPVSIINQEHSLVSYPNKITTKDFEGWTQERGLYFPGEWSAEYTPILSMNDTGEAPLKGSLLVAPYGKGHYIYTGLSFFRELPEGVPGAFKLFTNMLSIGKDQVKNDSKIKG